MRTILGIAPTALLLSLFAPSAVAAQTPSETAVHDFFNGQQMLVTYREGGSLYGTFYTLQVQFCRSGRYLTVGESRRHTVLDNEQVSRITDAGTWEITTIRGQMVLRYVSVSGQPNLVAVNVAPNVRLSLGDGSITVVKQGAAQCPGER
jgi:hypothetical protein